MDRRSKKIRLNPFGPANRERDKLFSFYFFLILTLILGIYIVR
jgi:hypothetical protein